MFLIISKLSFLEEIISFIFKKLIELCFDKVAFTEEMIDKLINLYKELIWKNGLWSFQNELLKQAKSERENEQLKQKLKKEQANFIENNWISIWKKNF